MPATHQTSAGGRDEIINPHILVGAGDCPTEIDREALYQQFQPLIAALIRRYGKDAELRLDLRGEIYYHFSCLVDAYDPQRGIPLVAYLTRMLSQRVFNYVRDYWRTEFRHQLTDVEFLEETNAGTTGPEDCLERMAAEEVTSALPAAIGLLPYRQRLVLVWRYYDGRSFAEIAEELQVKEATVRSLLRHGVNALRKRMAATAG